MTSTKFLFTCREVVYRNETISTSVLFKKENLVCLQSSENALDNEDKHKLLTNYKLKIDILNSETADSVIKHVSTHMQTIFKRKNVLGLWTGTIYFSCTLHS